MKKLLLFALITMLVVACGKKEDAENKAEKVKADSTEVVKVTVEAFDTTAVNLVSKTVEIEGTVIHVCAHAGKKCHIIGTNPDVKVKIDAGKEVGSFPAELEGSTIIAKGKVTEFRVDGAYLDNWEKDVNNAKTEAKDKEKEEEITHSCEITLERIDDYRKQIKESGKGYIGFYSIECTEYKTKEEDKK